MRGRTGPLWGSAQRAQSGSMKECALNQTGIPNVIQNIFLSQNIMGSLGFKKALQGSSVVGGRGSMSFNGASLPGGLLLVLL